MLRLLLVDCDETSEGKTYSLTNETIMEFKSICQ